MSRVARISFILVLIAMLGLVACERSKADVVDVTPTGEIAAVPGEDGDGEQPSGEEGEDFGISTATPEVTEPAETAEPGPTTVTIGEDEGEGEADQPTATPEDGEEAGETATPSDGEEETAEASPTATSEPEPTTAPTTTEDRIHVVQRGEWVYSIARQYEGVSPQDIIRANNLRSPNTVYVGQELVIPGVSSGDSGGQQTHVVQRGETLIGIARQYDTTVSALRNANNLSGDRIYAGQTLTIP